MDSRIKQHRLSIISNISSHFEPVPHQRDQFLKGHIAEKFAYGSKSLMFNKTGKEIKQGLQSVMTKTIEQKDQMMEHMKQCLKQVSIAPTKNADEYMLRGCDQLMDFIPKFFTWEECRKYGTQDESPIQNNKVVDSSELKSSTKDNCCEKYNMYARKYVAYCVDYCYLQVINRGLKDNKSYELTIDQCVNLGL